MDKDNKNSENDELKNKPNFQYSPKTIRNQADEEDEEVWWEQSMTRRDANVKIIVAGSVFFVAIAALAIFSDDNGEEGFDEDEEQELSIQSLEIQKKNGWNVGSDKMLTFPPNSIVEKDSKFRDDWKNYFNIAQFQEVLKPKSPELMPYFAPTLAQALDQKALQAQMKLIFTPEMARAYSQGLGYKEILKKNKNSESLLLISDLPGAESVAFAAALADIADPVFDFDNWPHPIGVVPSHHTLAAMLYFANELAEKKAARPDKAYKLLVLDRNRFVSKINEDTQFDNRYLARTPLSADLKKMGVSDINYLTMNAEAELDDLNADFLDYQKNGINCAMVNLADFKRTEADGSAQNPIANSGQAGAYMSAPPVYHYGGSPMFIPMFYSYHPYYSYSGRMPRTMPSANSGLRAPSYRPAPRPTIFSANSRGGGLGVGKTRPSGFGMVSARTSGGRGGRVTGIRAGRSGSFGRVGGLGG
jgi:hypothetical protein